MSGSSLSGCLGESYVSSLEMCYNPIGRGETESWNVWLSHMKWRFWEKFVENWSEVVAVCEIPIGRDDTGGSPVCVFYRDGLYRGKIGRKSWPKVAKTRRKWQIFHEWGSPWSFWAETRFKWVKKNRSFQLWSPFLAKPSYLSCFEGSGFFKKSGFFYFSGLCGYKIDTLTCL